WLMVIMKIPILYLCWVVYWAIKSEPRPDQPAALVADSDDSDPTRWRPGRQTDSRLCPHRSRYGSCMSATPYQRTRPAETIGGFLAAASIFVSLTGIA